MWLDARKGPRARCTVAVRFGSKMQRAQCPAVLTAQIHLGLQVRFVLGTQEPRAQEVSNKG